METKQKEFVTHQELDVWGGEIMRQLDEVRDDVKDIKENMVTKEDAEQFATKDDLERFATKEDLERFAIKEDLERFVTKVEFERLFLVIDEIRQNTKK